MIDDEESNFKLMRISYMKGKDTNQVNNINYVNSI